MACLSKTEVIVIEDDPYRNNIELHPGKDNWVLRCPNCQKWTVIYRHVDYPEGAHCNYYFYKKVLYSYISTNKTNIKVNIKCESKKIKYCEFRNSVKTGAMLFGCINDDYECEYDLCVPHAAIIKRMQDRNSFFNMKNNSYVQLMIY